MVNDDSYLIGASFEKKKPTANAAGLEIVLLSPPAGHRRACSDYVVFGYVVKENASFLYNADS
jgi:hypothetical protein